MLRFEKNWSVNTVNIHGTERYTPNPCFASYLCS